MGRGTEESKKKKGESGWRQWGGGGGLEDRGSIRRSAATNSIRLGESEGDSGIHFVTEMKAPIGGGQNKVEHFKQ
jgi:hypothetical protein